MGPESDHWQCLSLTHSPTHSLTNCRLVNLIDLTLACEDAYSKLVEVVTVADVSDEDRVGKLTKLILDNILKLGLVKILTLDLVEMLMFG